MSSRASRFAGSSITARPKLVATEMFRLPAPITLIPTEPTPGETERSSEAFMTRMLPPPVMKLALPPTAPMSISPPAVMKFPPFGRLSKRMAPPGYLTVSATLALTYARPSFSEPPSCVFYLTPRLRAGQHGVEARDDAGDRSSAGDSHGKSARPHGTRDGDRSCESAFWPPGDRGGPELL